MSAPPPALELSGPPRHLHLLGIGGTGMSAIAEVLVAMGHVVSGSDSADSAVLGRLRSIGVDALVGHDADHVTSPRLGPIDAVGCSTAIGASNPELVAARAAGIPVHHRFDLLAAIGATRRVVSISGTHGKTTTATLTAVALAAAGFDPGFIIGGDVGGTGVGSGSRWTDSGWFVLEADESDSTFLAAPRVAAVVTNLEADHLDHHGSYEALVDAFVRFVRHTDGPVVLCADDAPALALAPHAARPVTYGTSGSADYRIVDIERRADGSSWTVRHGEDARRVTVDGPGLHLVMNATAAFAVAVELGAEPSRVARGLASYPGVGRRFERRGEAAGVTFIDDYAHLPAEVRVVLDAARRGGWRRIVAVFQPHGFSRTVANAAEFGRALTGADLVLVTDVYPAREQPVPGVTGQLIADSVTAAGVEVGLPVPVSYEADRAALVEHLVAALGPGDLCLTLGAGDITSLPDDVLAALERS